MMQIITLLLNVDSNRTHNMGSHNNATNNSSSNSTCVYYDRNCPCLKVSKP